MKIAVMGCGTVGAGVVDKLDTFGDRLLLYSGEKISVKYILELRELHGTPYESRLVKDISAITDDPEIETAVEAMGGVEPAFSYCLECLKRGKNVVTSNKALVAEKAPELFEAAKKSGASFMFEAAVCGGIPLIRTLFSLRAVNDILSFSGIFNGTTNYILTEMTQKGVSFAAALRAAQDLGYAEKGPTDDIEGLDTCRKTCILASIACGTHIYPKEIHTEGINHIAPEDTAFAGAAGCGIKLLGRYEKLPNGKIAAVCAPFLVPHSELLSSVDGVFNAFSALGDNVGELMLFGRGAGRHPTASAVVSDIAEGARVKKNEAFYCWKEHSDGAVEDIKMYKTSLFVRGYAKNREKALSGIREAFGGIRLLKRENAPENELAFITPEGREGVLRETLGSLRHFVPASTIRSLLAGR